MQRHPSGNILYAIPSNPILPLRLREIRTRRPSIYAAMTSIFLPLTDFHSTANDPTIDNVANAAAT
jgi:hypothetical protein